MGFLSVTFVNIFTNGDEGAIRSTYPWGGEKEEEERWKFG